MSIMKEFKEVWELAKTVATVDLQEKILKLRGDVMDIEEQNLQLRAEVQDLKQQLKDLLAAGEIAIDLTYREPFYYNGEEGPFCPRCWDGDRKLFRVVHSLIPGTMICPQCDKAFQAGHNL